MFVARAYGGGAIPMGMNKSGNQTPSAGSWSTLTGWTARSGYSGTVIASNGLALLAGTYSIQLTLAFADNNNEVTPRLMRAGVVAVTGTMIDITTSLTATWNFPNVSWPTAGEIMTVQINPEYNDAISGGTGSYVIATPV